MLTIILASTLQAQKAFGTVSVRSNTVTSGTKGENHPEVAVKVGKKKSLEGRKDGKPLVKLT